MMDDLDPKLNEGNAAEALGLTRQTLAWRRKRSTREGKPCIPPFIIENGRAVYLTSELLKLRPVLRKGKTVYFPARQKAKRLAGHVSQRQAAILLGLSVSVLNYDLAHERVIPVWGQRGTPFYPLDGIKARLKGKLDRLLTFNQTARALDTTPQRLADHVTNVREGFPTMLDLPFEDTPSGAMQFVGFRLSAVIKAAEVLFQHEGE
ncbi:hypothetical protein EOJ32_10025 [Paracoccus sp. Arc7-R13]|uniref:hypothetical protein n=1 Tax=Paracoccus sp. Arc7-R13 TaxID=2500532 RepID=UPI000FDABC18|nr:hypothetical protein [Paracoccus sp. Arc7-R13]AZY93964.1 hypothetical protein EOJ32_10025 [Paracoccus sp. Arc7-R13]